MIFPPGSPIGRHYSANDKDIEVIGIAKDVKVNSLQEDPQPVDYYPYTQQVRYLNDFEVRYVGQVDALIPAVLQAMHEIDAHLPISDVTTLDEQVERSIADQRLVAQLSAFFGLLAIFLSCLGVYGVMSYVVTRRTSEIGIRLALGAGRSDVLWMILREILILAGGGIGFAVPVGLARDRLISNMLFGLKPTDPFTLVGATIILLTVAAIAGYVPARRASLVDPMVALPYD
jgi:ABC-type antimicrobial peptide transport system permease subunit